LKASIIIEKTLLNWFPLPPSMFSKIHFASDFKGRKGRKEQHKGKLTTNLFHSYFSFFRPI